MGTKKRPPKRMTPAEQSARFIETARKLEADERPKAFEEVLKKVTSRKSPKKKPRV